MMEQEIADAEIVKARTKMFAMIASLPTEVARDRAQRALAADNEVDLRPAPGVDEEPLGVV